MVSVKIFEAYSPHGPRHTKHGEIIYMNHIHVYLTMAETYRLVLKKTWNRRSFGQKTRSCIETCVVHILHIT
jgi:hypothetical protein